MGLKYFFLVSLIFVSSARAGVEHVSTSRVFTPTPFVPSMMTFAVDYILRNDLAVLNKFEFYNSYVESARFFTVDKFALSKFETRDKQCLAKGKKEIKPKDLMECGRVLAALYVESHNVIPEDFGFKKVTRVATLQSDGNVFFFVGDNGNVLLHGASDHNLKEGKRYELELTLSPFGDYDLREVGVPFAYEAYLYGASPEQTPKSN